MFTSVFDKLGRETMPTKPQPTLEDCNCFAARSAARHVTQLYDQFLAPVGLHVTQFSMLARLNRLGPMTINALAREMLMDRTTLSRNILPLERDGLVTSKASAADGRAKELHLTRAGGKRLEAARAAWVKAQARFEARIGAERSADFRAMLRAVVATDLVADANP
jgi:DNA-binding MarR family transcriptional regulator